LLENFYKTATTVISQDRKKPFVDECFYYAVRGRFMAGSKKNTTVERLPNPYAPFYKLD